MSSRAVAFSWMFAIAAILCGLLLLAGLATPFAAAAVSLSGIAAGLISFIDTTVSVPELPILFLIFAAAAIVLLGPGAFSIDSRLFGRRRIVIPDRNG